MHSCALIDGLVSLQQGSADAIAEHLSIGVKEPHHRHSGVVQSPLKGRGHKQDNVRSVVVDLHQVSSAHRGAPCSNDRVDHLDRPLKIRPRGSCVGPEQLAFLGRGTCAQIRLRGVRIAAIERAVDPHRVHDDGQIKEPE